MRRILTVLLLAATALLADPAPSVLQARFAVALETARGFQEKYPTLAAALIGKGANPAATTAEFLSLPIDRSEWIALGNAAQGLLDEKTTRGAGTPRILEAARLAGSDLGLQWFLVLSQLHFGTISGFHTQVDGLEAAMLTSGWQRLPEASSWLLAASEEFIRAGKDSLATAALQEAERLDPVSPVPPWEAGTQLVRAGNASEAYPFLAEAFQRMLSYPANQQILAFNSLRLLRYSLALASLLLLLGWLVRYWPFITHHLAERLPRDSHLYLRYTVLAVGFSALLVAGMGLMATTFLSAALLWKHARKYERGLIALILVFAGTQPWLAGIEAELARRFDQASPEALYQRAVEEGWSQDLESRISEAIATSSSTPLRVLKIARSITLRKKGDYTASFVDAREGYSPGSSDPRGAIHLGNLFFLTGKYDSAERLYLKAQEIDPENPILLFNRAQSASFRGRTDSTAILIRETHGPARYRVDVATRQNSRHFQALPPNRMTLDPEVSGKIWWSSLFDDLIENRRPLDRWDLHTGLVDIPPSALPITAGGLLFGLMLWTSLFPPKRKTLFKCKTCNRVMCTLCRKGIHCTQCFKRLSGVDEIELRNDLLERIDRESLSRQKMLHLGLDLALPGTGRLVATPGFLAFLQVFTLAACLSYALNLPSFLSLYPAEQTLAGRLVAISILIALYAWGALQLARSIGRTSSLQGGR